ncbi:hypothetical protein EJ02DRAFT_353990 [Clathrospora elynae]|uniref:Uncharacterized protein n=1 Tax=Clathrospora elynae TaxID=706981 RepID=A0A6A5SFP7_9PLEO|nr:hypothetical protein EJ02DRAFT_353990 [Clathrospora elynae]
MPAIAHLQRRILEDSEGNGGISGTSIALIVCLGIVPAIALFWVVCYLFWAYPNDRNCCCVKRRRGADKPDMVQRQGDALSENTMYEKQGFALPQRPFATHASTESGNFHGTGSGRLAKQDRSRPSVTKADTRMSLQSVASANTMQAAHEPQRFV